MALIFFFSTTHVAHNRATRFVILSGVERQRNACRRIILCMNSTV